MVALKVLNSLRSLRASLDYLTRDSTEEHYVLVSKGIINGTARLSEYSLPTTQKGLWTLEAGLVADELGKLREVPEDDVRAYHNEYLAQEKLRTKLKAETNSKLLASLGKYLLEDTSVIRDRLVQYGELAKTTLARRNIKPFAAPTSLTVNKADQKPSRELYILTAEFRVLEDIATQLARSN